jgi:hypothetical protein
VVQCHSCTHLSSGDTGAASACSVPDADLLPALPQLLGPLLAMASDPNRELRQAVLKTLQVGHCQNVWQ